MTRHVLLSGRLSTIGKTNEPLALFASMIAVFYNDVVLANGYGEAMGLYLSHCVKCRPSQLKLDR